MSEDVSEIGRVAEAADGGGRLLQSAYGAENKVLEQGGASDHLTSAAVVLHMVPHPLVWVQLGRIGRQIERPQVALVSSTTSWTMRASWVECVSTIKNTGRPWL